MTMMTCSVDSCERPVKTRGMCGMHTERARAGKPLDAPPKWQLLPDDWRELVTPSSSGCHEWGGAISSVGYGYYKRQYVHRLAYEAAKGPIPDGLQIDHLCRNRKCCNPEHLEAVTIRENVLVRGMGPSAVVWRSGFCARGHEMTPENTYRRPSRPNKRECRTCIRLRRREREAAA